MNNAFFNRDLTESVNDDQEDGYKLKPEPAVEDLSTLKSSGRNSAGYLVSDSITEKMPQGRPRKRVSPESATGNAGTAGNAVITKKRPRGRPLKMKAVKEPEDCNKLDPARLDEVVAMFKANDHSEPPVNVSLPHLMSEAQKPSSDSKDDIANGGSTGFAEEVALMEKVNKYSHASVSDEVHIMLWL